MIRMETDKQQTTSKELQEHFGTDGVIIHRSTFQHTLHKEKLDGKVMRKNKQSYLRYAKAHLDKPELFWNNMLWTGKV